MSWQPDCCPSPSLRPRGSYQSRPQYRCLSCGATLTHGGRRRPSTCDRLVYLHHSHSWAIIHSSSSGYRVTYDRRGYARVRLGVGHPYANSSGWQWLHRFLAMSELGRPLRSDEHVNHMDRSAKATTDLNLLEVVLAEYHGQSHAYATTLAGGRDSKGRFKELDEPGPTRVACRYGAVIGQAAMEI